MTDSGNCHQTCASPRLCLHSALLLLVWLAFSSALAAAGTRDDFALAAVHERQGEYELALQHYQAYLAGKPFSVNKRVAKTRLAILEKGLTAGQDDGLALYLTAMAARERGDYDLALAHLQQLQKAAPASAFAADARYLAAYIQLMDRFDYAEALVQMQRVALSAEKQYGDTALYSQAIALEQLGRLDQARDAFVAIRDRHAMLSNDWLGVYLPRGNFQSRFWFSRATRRIDAIDQLRAVQSRTGELLGGDFSYAIGARYHYDNPVGSGRQYRYIWNILDQHKLPATHFTHWYTRSTDWRWESAAPLLAATEAGLTPVISHWWFGDEISPEFVRDNRSAYLANISEKLVPLLQQLPDAIVLLEPEFNKRGIEAWPHWDEVATEAVEAIKRDAPHVRVGLVMGDWASFEDASALENIERAVAASDFVGFMLMTSAGNETADLNPVWSVRERVQRAAHALQQRWDKPLYFGYMALSSADNWSQRQAEYLRQLIDYTPMLASYGVFGAGYFSLLDNPQQRGWFGAAENHFGLLRADSTDKPAAEVWRRSVASVFTQDHTIPAITAGLQLQDDYRLTARFGEWVRWQLRLTGDQSGAHREFRGAGNRLSRVWRGEADTGEFINEAVTARLYIEDKGGNQNHQTLQFQFQCDQPCTELQTIAFDHDFMQRIRTRNGASVRASADATLEVALSARHSAVMLALPGTLKAGDRIRMQIEAGGLVEGLGIGLIDEHHYQIDLPLERFIDESSAGWHSITIGVDDFPDNARRFGQRGKKVQFGPLQLHDTTRLMFQQRLNTGTIYIRDLRIERALQPPNLLLSGVPEHAG